MNNVLIIATTSYAGMGPYVINIVNGFYQDDCVFFFFCEYDDWFFKKNINQELYCKSTFLYTPNTKWNKIRNVLPIKKKYHNSVIAFCKKNKIQVVHFINGPGDRILVKSLNCLNIVSVSTVHDLHPHECKKEWYKELFTRIKFKQLVKNLNVANNIITNSPTQYELLRRENSNKHVFFHDFPSLVTKAVAAGTKKIVELEKTEKPYILFFGRIEEYKGISLLYEAFITSPEINEKYNLLIAGEGKLPMSSNNENNIIYLNRYIEDEEVAFLYLNASCVVYPYISATQSGVLSLAFFFKTPVLCSDVSFFKDIINRSAAGKLFKRGDVSDLKTKLIELLNINNNKMIENGIHYYENNYDKRAISEKLIQIYDYIG